MVSSTRGGSETKFAVYDVKAIESPGKMINIAAEYVSPKIISVNVPPAIHASRYILGMKSQCSSGLA